MNVQNRTPQQLNNPNFKGIYFTKYYPITSKDKYMDYAIEKQTKVVGVFKYVEDTSVYSKVRDAFKNNPFFKKLGETGDIFVISAKSSDLMFSTPKNGQKEKMSFLKFWHIDYSKKSVDSYESAEFGYDTIYDVMEQNAKKISKIKNEEDLKALKPQ